MTQNMVKVCPDCLQQAHLDAQQCARCGHRFRTKFHAQTTVMPSFQPQKAVVLSWWHRWQMPVLVALIIFTGGFALVKWYQHLRPPIVGTWKSSSLWMELHPNGEAMITRPPEEYGSDAGWRDFIFADDSVNQVPMRWRTRSTLLYLTNPARGRETDPMRFSISEDNLAMTLYVGRIPIDFYRAD